MEVQKDFRYLLELFNKQKVEGFFGDLTAHYVGRDDFIANKRAVGRKKDMADLEAVGEA